MGFNGVRKHQKIEDPRYLYWADRLGLLVWEEMPSAYRFTHSVDRAAHARVDRGDRARLQPSRASSPGCRSTSRGACRTCPTSRPSGTSSQALYHLTKTLDPTRPVIGNDGWESVATDIIGIHDYDDDPERIARALRDATRRSRSCFQRERPGGRLLVARRAPARRPADHADRVRRHRLRARTPTATWGYSRATTRRRARRSATRAARDGALDLRSSPASATRSSPTPTRRRTGSCTPTARRSSRSRRSRARRAARGPPARSRPTSSGGADDEVPAAHRDPRRPRRRCTSARSRSRTAGALLLYGGSRCRRSTAPRFPIRAPRRAANPHLRWHPLRERMGRLRAATARTARSCRRRSTTRSRRPSDPRARPSCRPATGTSRCSRTASRRSCPSARRRPRRSSPPRPARGACEVVVFTQDGDGALGALPLAHIELLIEVWADRTRELGGRDDVDYVMPFENRGRRGRRDAPPPARADLRLSVRAADCRARAGAAARHLERHGRGCSRATIAAELRRTAGGCSTTGPQRSPSCRRAPATPTRCGSRRAARCRLWPTLDDDERADLARALKTVLLQATTGSGSGRSRT